MSTTSMSFRYGMHWSRTKGAIRRRDKGVCVRCGGRFLLTVHHFDGDRRNRAFDNLATLCEPCHREAAAEDAKETPTAALERLLAEAGATLVDSGPKPKNPEP